MNSAEFFKLVKKSSFGRFDRAAVQLDDRSASLSGLRAEGSEKRRFTASPDSVELGDNWAVVVQAVKELGELSPAANHPRGRLLCQDVSDSPSHGQSRCWSKRGHSHQPHNIDGHPGQAGGSL